MELERSFLFGKFFLIICAFLVQECSGFSLQQLSITSLILPNIVKTPDLNLYEKEQRYKFLQTDIALAPTAFHSQAPHPSMRAPNVHFRHPTKTKIHKSSAVSPHNNRHVWKKIHHIAPEPNHHRLPPSSYIRKGPVITPSPSPFPSSRTGRLPLPAIPHKRLNGPSPSPAISPVSSSMVNNKNALPPLPSLILPPPPPNQGCVPLTCSDPLTYTPPGVPCGCVYPVQVRLRFRVSLYTFFPLVPELSKEISMSLRLDRSQVRIMGADSADEERTIVLVNLLPLGDKFNASTASSIYAKFWRREVSIPRSTFGAYEVLYVRYPGLPPSPPSMSSYPAIIGVQPNPGSTNDDEPIKPLGVDVPRHTKNDSSKSMAIVIVLSSVTAFIVFMGCTLLLLSKMGCCSFLYRKKSRKQTHTEEKPSGADRLLTFRSKASSNTMSLSSSLLACTGTAKVFTINEIEIATDNFNSSRILGEGGFGLVYGGALDDGREVAVKVLKRDDQQGGREFLAEVEMLGRLHHRNLVKLIGICAEDQCRCLVYDLVPFGSVESHLHGVDKEVAPLDWSSRMKIALGAARGLAYLHEDSSPRVIHRDFKSSNILLENDFTPKVSDFGLARTAMDEGNRHVSTHVMGTFGYLAPEYAMTGHLLVKSDVYSYGVVLLELLTGRKPVDLTQRPGQENLVSWARPLLTTTEGLEMMFDPTLKSDVPLESVARVAAIASMCVQPEVSHRPFMGEVVQALKLVCDEFEETKERISRTCSQDDLSIDLERLSNELMGGLEKYDSNLDSKVTLSAVDLKSASVGFGVMESESFRRQFNSAPLKMERKRKFWQRLRGLSRGSMSEHESSTNF